MKTLIAALAASTLAVSAAGLANAEPDHRGPAPSEQRHDAGPSHHWSRGERLGEGDWARAQPVDYRAHHLRAPPRGYEWRESNGQYVLAAVATGLIASIVLESGR